jgi:hypothetical protein
MLILAKEKDVDGMPKADVHVGLRDGNLRLIKLMIQRCDAVADVSGVEKAAIFTSLDAMGAGASHL